MESKKNHLPENYLDNEFQSYEDIEIKNNLQINTNFAKFGKNDELNCILSEKNDILSDSKENIHNKDIKAVSNSIDFNNKLVDIVDIVESNDKLNINHTASLKKGLFISKKSRNYLFVLLIFTSIFVNLDHGTIPAATEELEKSLNIDKTTIGTFGSLVFIGTAAGALYYIFLVNKINRKLNLAISFFLSGVLLCLFTFVKNVPFLFFNRLVVGFFQSMVSIYIPIWIDQYSPSNRKTFYMAVFQLSSPFGLICGYILTSLIKDKHSVSIYLILTLYIFI
jgi:hypothetical protein